jgi:hypothetical protein
MKGGCWKVSTSVLQFSQGEHPYMQPQRNTVQLLIPALCKIFSTPQQPTPANNSFILEQNTI